jgi:hypothetical protein
MDTDPDPDQHALDADPYSDQVPPKLCEIRIQIWIHNTAKEKVHHAKGHHFKDAVLKGWFLCAG